MCNIHVSVYWMLAQACSVEKHNLIVATSLFNITLNVCQVIPLVVGLLLFDLFGLIPVLALVAGLYLAATLCVLTMPPRTRIRRAVPVAGSLRRAGRQVVADVHEAIIFLSRERGLRLTLLQVNVPPMFMFVFGVLGLAFVQQTFGLGADRAWVLMLPAGAGLICGALATGPLSARAPKETLINAGLLLMGAAIAVLGTITIVVGVVGLVAGRVGHFIARHVHSLPPAPHSMGLLPTAIAIALVIGFGMALSTIPAQTLVLERTTDEVRGRVLSLQQTIGGALPIVPLLTVAPLADIFGSSAVMTALGVGIVLFGASSVHLGRRFQCAACG